MVICVTGKFLKIGIDGNKLSFYIDIKIYNCNFVISSYHYSVKIYSLLTYNNKGIRTHMAEYSQSP